LDATGAILFFGLVAAVLLGGLGVYFVSRTDAGAALWEGFKERLAAYNARAAARASAARREQEIGIEVSLPPAYVLARVVEHMTRQGWGVSNQSQNSVTFARDEGADACIGCVLMLVFIVPGLLYLLLANRTARLTVAAYPHEEGARVIVGGEGMGGEGPGALTDWVKRLAEEPSDLPPALEESKTHQDPRTLGETLRELAELKEAGLITPEEFEAKKRDLLDKM
jgi:hypothetical protein